MANKRVSELVQVTAGELQASDLLLLADVSANESKKLTLQDIGSYLLSSGNITGSFYGTASYALVAKSASYAPSIGSASYSSTSSWSWNCLTASNTLIAEVADFSVQTTYAISSSYAATSSVQSVISSSFADNARSASFLRYIGTPNGTSSYSIYSKTASFSLTVESALTASYVLSSSFSLSSSISRTSSYLGYTSGVSNGTSSYSILSNRANTSSLSNSSSYLIYTPGVPNGTASYAMNSEMLSIRLNHGMYKALVQSTTASIIDITFPPTVYTEKSSSVQSVGTVIIASGSIVDTGFINLITLDRWSGITKSLDSTFIYNVSSSGTKIPFTLMGEIPMMGAQTVYVTASGGITLDSNRLCGFGFNSFHSSMTTTQSNPPVFDVVSTSSILGYVSSSSPTTVYFGSASQVRNEGLDKITALNISSSYAVSSINYVWTLPNLTSFTCYNLPLITRIGGMPNSIITMSCYSCNINSFAPFIYNVSLSRFNCNDNELTTFPLLPSTMSYINCSYNSITTLPTLPYGLNTFIGHHNLFSSLPISLPTTLVSMSINHNNLSSWYSTIPSSLLYLDVSYCNLSEAAVEFICATIDSNGQSNGYLNIYYNNTYSAATLVSISSLEGKGWTVIYGEPPS